MVNIKKIGIFFVILSICSINAFGADTRRHEGKRPGPPPEAYTACEGKSAGDTAEMETPNGETMTGTCVQEGDDLVLKPDNMGDGPGGRHHGPPEEAYEACEGKSAGDTAEFVNDRGDTITGTCEEHGDQLVLRPDNMPPRR